VKITERSSALPAAARCVRATAFGKRRANGFRPLRVSILIQMIDPVASWAVQQASDRAHAQADIKKRNRGALQIVARRSNTAKASKGRTI